MSDEAEAPGWDAIDRVLNQHYPSQEPLHFGTVIKYSMGGNDPLDGTSVYSRQDPVPHWHYITYGFSELYEKESEDPEWSGFGFEMTFRLSRNGQAEPPVWPIALMQNLARYVFNSGNIFQVGDHLDLNGPIFLEADTDIRAVAFRVDPELGENHTTPFGRLDFRQMVGLTLDELRFCKNWKTSAMLELMEKHTPLGVTDIRRKSLLQDPEIRAAAQAGLEKDGSNCGMLFVQQGGVEVESNGIVLTIGALLVGDLCTVLPGRVPFDRPLLLRIEDQVVRLEQGDKVSWQANEEGTTVTLTSSAARQLAAQLKVKAGDYTFSEAPGVTVKVIQTNIKDRHGNVVETLG